MKRSLTATFGGVCLSLGLSSGCSSDFGDEDPEIVRVHVGNTALVLDAREILNATGEFSITALAEGGTVSVEEHQVRFLPDTDLGFSQITINGSAPGGDSAQAVVNVFNAPFNFSFTGVIDDGEGQPHSQYMTAYSGAVRGDRFGDRIFEAGDYNGDGYGDFLVTAPRANLPYIDQGAIYLLEGGPSGLRGPYLLLEGDVSNEQLARLAKAGDLDGDGLTDVIFPVQQDEGTNYTIMWGAAPDDIAVQTVELPTQVVEFIADLDGDGRAEIGVEGLLGERVVYSGATRDNVASDVAIEIDSCTGSPTTITPGELWVLGDVAQEPGIELAFHCSSFTRIVSSATGETITEFTGPRLPTQGVGDLDGNGTDDFIVKSTQDPKAYVELGGLEGVEGEGCTQARLPVPSSARILATTKDVDRDGTRDLIYSRGASETSTGWETGLWLSSVESCDPLAAPPRYPWFGTGVRSAISSDIDDDGEQELLLGALGGAGHVVTFDLP